MPDESLSEDRLEELERSLEVTRPTLELALRRYRDVADPAVTRPLDGFLGFLRREGVIDADAYRRVSADAEVSVETLAASLTEDGPQYEVFEKIAEGGMGEIRVARDRRLRHRVALKSLKPHGDAAGALCRFVTEAQVTAQLDHPNIVPVYGLQFDQEDRRVSFAMKMVQGKTLAELFAETVAQHRAGAVDDEHALPARLELYVKLCEAVGYAHSKGVLHRDLKPANVMVGSFGEVYVMDWGLARVSHGARAEPEAAPGGDLEISGSHGDGLTRADQVVGTPIYMSPEQAEGRNKELCARSDQYALGLILYELCTLRRALEGRTTAEVLGRAARGELRPIAADLPGVRIAPELRAVIAKATARDRGRRYAGVEELAADVRRILRGEAVLARPDPPLQALLRWIGRHRMRTLAVLMAVVATASVAIALALHSRARALADSQRRERVLTEFQSEVASRAHRIDRQFSHLEGLLAHLARRAAERLEGAPGDDGAPLYDNDAFARGEPPDLARAPLYDMVISVDHPVHVLAPGVTEDQVGALVRRLAPIAADYRWLLLRSDPASEAFGAKAELRAALDGDGLPVRWVYVGLAEGVMLSYPGKSGYPSGYDPRLRPWYRLGAGRRTPRWGNPYIDLQGQGIVLPGAVAIVAADGRELGVAGAEVTFDHVIRAHLLPDGPILAASLIDERGRVVVSSTQLDRRYEGGELHDALELPAYPVAEVVVRVERGESGQVVADDRLVSFHPVASLGWYYVVEADLARLLD